jgi:hypothetical protein
MQPQIEVKPRTLEDAIDALEGLAAMAVLAAARPTTELAPLRDELTALDGFGQTFGCLRYAGNDPQVWLHVAANVNRIRDELLRCYADAAM